MWNVRHVCLENGSTFPFLALPGSTVPRFWLGPGRDQRAIWCVDAVKPGPLVWRAGGTLVREHLQWLGLDSPPSVAPRGQTPDPNTFICGERESGLTVTRSGAPRARAGTGWAI